MRSVNAENWRGYMFIEDDPWSRFNEESDQTNNYLWWSMVGEDGIEGVSIPTQNGWHDCDSRLVGQLIKMFGRRRLAYHKMSLVADPLFSQRQEPLTYWEEVLA